ncbi:hypothetical protein F4680DRAFT_290421 [Xylaria scruposa]|nr:hypothetical protein F4680DRAFT_290421 [Xylaria scruposa]
MCIKSYIHYTKCDHVNTSLTSCPTYHKEQESAKGFLGCVFGRNIKKKEHCGKVVPHHLQSGTYCQACTIRHEQFSAQGVGNGALKVRQHGFQEISHGEDKEAARLALQKAAKSRRHGGRPNHDVIYTETSVWLNDLYHHPETLARKESYARQAARAPPVSSHHRTEGRPRVVEPSPRTRLQKPQPKIKPVQQAPAHPWADYLPEPVGHSPHMPRDYQSFAARARAAEFPDPRRKASHNTTRGHNDHTVSPRQAYMDGEVESEDEFQAEQQPRTPRPYWERDTSRWETKKASISSWIEKHKTGERDSKPEDDDSDVSFVCQTSRTISNQQAARNVRRKHRQSAASGRSRYHR